MRAPGYLPCVSAFHAAASVLILVFPKMSSAYSLRKPKAPIQTVSGGVVAGSVWLEWSVMDTNPILSAS